MRTWAVMLSTGLALAAGAASAAPQPDPGRIAAMAQRFEPFDKSGQQGWEALSTQPVVRTAPEGGNDAVQFDLKPGSYMIVALCNCDQMDVTLVRPDASEPRPARSSDQAAMYSIDVTAPGTYLTGVDMGACSEKSCDFGVKVWRKK